jgi:hypothetical protein
MAGRRVFVLALVLACVASSWAQDAGCAAQASRSPRRACRRPPGLSRGRVPSGEVENSGEGVERPRAHPDREPDRERRDQQMRRWARRMRLWPS